MALSVFSNNGTVTGTTVTFTFPTTAAFGDIILLVAQSATSNTTATLTTPSGYSSPGRVPSTGAYPHYSFRFVATGGETTAVSTQSLSAAVRWGVVMIRGADPTLTFFDDEGNTAPVANLPSLAMNVPVGGAIFTLDGVRNTASNTYLATSSAGTWTELFDTGSTGNEVWVAAAWTGTSLNAGASSVTNSNTRTSTPSAHTAFWFSISPAPTKNITATNFANTNTFGTALVNPAIQPTKFTNTNTFGVAAIAGGTFQLLATRFVSVTSFGSPTIQNHKVDIAVPADIEISTAGPTVTQIQFMTEVDALAVADGPTISTFSEEIGFEVVVRSHTDYSTIIAVIGDYIELTIGPELSAEGNGSIVMDADSPFWYTTLPDGNLATTLLDFEHLWEVYERGVKRFEFLGMSVREVIVDEDLNRGISVAGPGTAEFLKWGKVMPPTFPGNAVSPYKFTSSTIMGAFISLLNAVKNRGTIPWITPTFTGLVDSAGVSWADRSAPIPFEPTEGIDLLDLLEVCTGQDVDQQAVVQAEWFMRPGFQLESKPTIGIDKSQTVIFYDNSTKTIERTRLRDEIYNYILVSDGQRKTSLGNAGLAAASRAKWNQREWYEKKPETILSTDRQVLANGLQALMQDEKSTWVIEVSYDVPGHRPFVDYDIGDTVGVARYIPVGVNPLTGAVTGGTRTVETYRVLAIVLKVQNDGEVLVELTLQSRLETKQRSLQRQISRLLYDINNPKPRNWLQRGSDDKDFTNDDFLCIEIPLPDPGWPYYVEASGGLQWVNGHNVGYDVFIHMDDINGEIFSIGWGLWNTTSPPIDVTVRVSAPTGRTENTYSGEHSVQMWLERNRDPGSTPGNGVTVAVSERTNFLYVTQIKA